MESMIKKVGSWLFLIGICVAILVGLVIGAMTTLEQNTTNIVTPLTYLMAILGFVVGVLSFFALGAITHEKIPTFLTASLILIVLAVAVTSATWIFGSFGKLSPIFTSITYYLAIFVAPAAIILVVRALWDAGVTKESTK